MANVVVLGTQWGDEGKGKIVDLVTPAFDVVARYQGGHNAGHTVYVDGRKVVLHLIPSGILHPDKVCVIGNGVVVSPRAFLEEAASLEALGIRLGARLIISKNAHIIMPYHELLERISEERLGLKRIGTTSRGIGPAYEDKTGRRGIRAADLVQPEILKEMIRDNLAEKNALLERGGLAPLDPDKVYEEYAAYGEKLGPFIQDASFLLNHLIKLGKPMLFEGAQGALLDIDQGTYPYVTASNAGAGGACTGLGIGPNAIHSVLGIAKAYTTRVGGGPFPTELLDETGQAMLKGGDEFGATTGRPRRCGWFDAVAVAYTCRVNGVENLVLTKPDVLDGLGEVKICTGYSYLGEDLKSFPVESWMLDKITPVYKTLKGWSKPLAKATDLGALPREFKDYLAAIEDLVEARVAIISTGCERKDTILLTDRLKGILDVSKLQEQGRC